MTLLTSTIFIRFVKRMSLLKFLILFITILSFTIVNAQESGKVSGKVVDAETGEALIGANVLVVGTSLGAAADIEGNYIINQVPVGTHKIKFSVIGYSKKIIADVVVNANAVTKISISLDLESIETDEVVITAKLLLDNEAGLLIQRQKSNSVADAISAEEMAKSGAGDAADAVKKVVGATIVDGKYVYVRGLGERYSSTQLNGAELPSSDPNKKAFQLDLLPTNLLDNIITIKTFTPDKSGNFSGGIVDIGTKSFPDKFTLKVSNSSSYNSQTTGNNNFITHGGGENFLGFDNGSRELPSIFNNQNIEIPIKQLARYDEAQAKALDQYSKAFSSVMDVKKGSAPINQSYGISVGDRIQTGKNSSLGYLGSITYNRSFSFYENGKVGRYSLTDINSDELNPQLLLNDNKGVSEANLGGLATLAYNFNNEHQIGGNIFYSRSGTSTSRSQHGKWVQEFGDDPNAPVYLNQVLGYVERDIISYQLRGDHKFTKFLNSSVDWSVSLSETNQDEPDLRLISSSVSYSENDTNYTIVGSNFDDPSRYFRKLEDNSNSYNLNFSIPFSQWAGIKSKLKLGVSHQSMKREFNEKIFSYSPDNRIFNSVNGDVNNLFADDNNGIVSTDTSSSGRVRYNFGNIVRDNSKLKNNYTGDQSVNAVYAMVELPILRDLKFVGGVRYEATDVTVASKDTTYKEGNINEEDFLPSFNLIYQLTENMNFRFAATQTLARPNFRELAPYSTKEFVNDVVLQGNPALKRTLIQNLDLRWEWFTRPGEILAISGFYKKLDNPIELAFAEGSTKSNPIVVYTNVDEATIMGLEFEARMRLDKVSNFLGDFSIGANLSIVNSEINIAESELVQRRAIDANTKSTRKLQGQSPVIFNINLSYANVDWGTTAGLHFNTFGERLAKVSANITPDVYEQPATQLDLVVSQKLTEFIGLKFKMRNMLNSSYKEVYRYKGKDYTFYEYKKGISYSVGLSYSL